MQIKDVINRLIREFNYKSYCEIGYLQGYTHTDIICPEKLAVDPTPQRSRQDMLNRGDNVKVMTSDEFFRINTLKFDMFFIDGCHYSQFVYRDIVNGFRNLNPGGCLVLHDICPYFKSWSRDDQCGDAFKAYMACRARFENMKMYVIDYFDKVEDKGPPGSDSSGWGLVFQGMQELWKPQIEYTWEYMDAHKKDLMNVRPLDEIIAEQIKK
jgi:hypothetical protein